MHYLTFKEYADLLNVSRQAIEDRVERGTLVPSVVKVKAKRIAVEDAEYAELCSKALARSKGEA